MAGESRLVREAAMEAGIKALSSDSRTDQKPFLLIFSGILCALRAEGYV